VVKDYNSTGSQAAYPTELDWSHSNTINYYTAQWMFRPREQPGQPAQQSEEISSQVRMIRRRHTSSWDKMEHSPYTMQECIHIQILYSMP